MKLNELRFVLFEGTEVDVQGRLNDFCRSKGAEECEFVDVRHAYAAPEWYIRPLELNGLGCPEFWAPGQHAVLLVFEEKTS